MAATSQPAEHAASASRPLSPGGPSGKLRLLFVADARSPIATSWMGRFIEAGHEVHVVSSYPCEPTSGAATFTVIPVAFSAASAKATSGSSRASRLLRRLPLGILSAGRGWLGPLDVLRHERALRATLKRIRPAIVHAMRIPFEGLLAAEAMRSSPCPLLISTWGNDLTLHAAHSIPMAIMTRRALHRADALHSDCARDVRLAARYGFSSKKPSVVIPGNAGLSMDMFSAGGDDRAVRERFDIPGNAPIVLNPRGIRSYVRNDVFVRAIEIVRRSHPEVVFVGVGLANDAPLGRLIEQLGVGRYLRLTGPLSREELRDLFRASMVSVSPAEHDGTPNTLLEAMACGAFPVVGDIESVREWITHTVNGLLFDPGSDRALASALEIALADAPLRARAARANRAAIIERADIAKSIPRMEHFYRTMAARGNA